MERKHPRAGCIHLDFTPKRESRDKQHISFTLACHVSVTFSSTNQLAMQSDDHNIMSFIIFFPTSVQHTLLRVFPSNLALVCSCFNLVIVLVFNVTVVFCRERLSDLFMQYKVDHDNYLPRYFI